MFILVVVFMPKGIIGLPGQLRSAIKKVRSKGGLSGPSLASNFAAGAKEDSVTGDLKRVVALKVEGEQP